jgi:sarcosine oxidase subunit alpha
VIVIDEFMKPGGRLIGQFHEESSGHWWNGAEVADALVRQTKTPLITLLLETSVYHIEKNCSRWRVYTNKGRYEAELLLIATGAAEKSLPVPGWTLPGVMTIGAAQVMANVHHVKPGKRGIIIGINVLSLAIARELTMAGVVIEAIVLPGKNALTQDDAIPLKVFETLLNVTHLAPSLLLKAGGALAKRSPFLKKLAITGYPQRGFKIWGIPIRLRQAACEIQGIDQVEKVVLASVTPEGTKIANSERTVPVDFVCVAGGLYPLVELAGVCGCPFKYIPSLGGHVPIHNEFMQTPLDGLYVAGNITGIESAKVAMAQGRLAGLAMAFAKNKSVEKQTLDQARHDVEAARGNALLRFHPDIQQGRDELRQVARQHVASDVCKKIL